VYYLIELFLELRYTILWRRCSYADDQYVLWNIVRMYSEPSSPHHEPHIHVEYAQ